MAILYAVMPDDCTRAMQHIYSPPSSSASAIHYDYCTIAHHSCRSLETPPPPLITILDRRCPFSLCPRSPAPPLSAVIAWSSARLGAGTDAAPPPLSRGPHSLSCRLRARRCVVGGRPVNTVNSISSLLISWASTRIYYPTASHRGLSVCRNSRAIWLRARRDRGTLSPPASGCGQISRLDSPSSLRNPRLPQAHLHRRRQRSG